MQKAGNAIKMPSLYINYLNMLKLVQRYYLHPY
jgi:hypothetical protein